MAFVTYVLELVRVVMELADYGVLRFQGRDPHGVALFQLSAPILRDIILSECFQVRPLPPVSPNTFNNPYDVVKFILDNTNPEHLLDRRCWNKSTGFPSEYTFQAEFFAILREALRSVEGIRWTVIVEAKVGGKRADILIQDGHRYLFELKACATISNEIINQASNYAKQLCCDWVAVVNLCPVYTNTQYDSTPHKRTQIAENGVSVELIEVGFNTTTFRSYSWKQ